MAKLKFKVHGENLVAQHGDKIYKIFVGTYTELSILDLSDFSPAFKKEGDCFTCLDDAIEFAEGMASQ